MVGDPPVATQHPDDDVRDAVLGLREEEVSGVSGGCWRRGRGLARKITIGVRHYEYYSSLARLL